MYVIKNNKTEKYIAIDKTSGGYPYDTGIEYSEVFKEIKEAEIYKNIFSSYDWSIHKLIIYSEPI